MKHWQHVMSIRNQEALLRITEGIALGLEIQNSWSFPIKYVIEIRMRVLVET